MKPGPKPKPTALRLFEGNPGNLPINGQEPAPPAVLDLSPPQWLDDTAQGVWNALAPVLDRIGVLTEIDAGALGRYCDAWSKWFQAKEVIDREGLTFETEDKWGEVKIKPRPEFASYMKLGAELRAMEAEFGLTPAARSRIVAHVRQPSGLQPQEPKTVEGQSVRRPEPAAAPNPFDYAAQARRPRGK